LPEVKDFSVDVCFQAARSAVLATLPLRVAEVYHSPSIHVYLPRGANRAGLPAGRDAALPLSTAGV
jgi:hypothetical protein